MKYDIQTPQEAAAFLKSSTSTLAKLRVCGGGPRYFRIGRAVRYRIADLEAWMQSSAATSTSSYAKRSRTTITPIANGEGER